MTWTSPALFIQVYFSKLRHDHKKKKNSALLTGMELQHKKGREWLLTGGGKGLEVVGCLYEVWTRSTPPLFVSWASLSIYVGFFSHVCELFFHVSGMIFCVLCGYSLESSPLDWITTKITTRSGEKPTVLSLWTITQEDNVTSWSPF